MELSTTLTILSLSIVILAVVVKIIYPLFKSNKIDFSDSKGLRTSEQMESIEIQIENEEQKTLDVLNQFDESELTGRIYELLVLQGIYRQQNLTVGEFAKKLGVQARIVTQILEKLYGHTFKELTTMYRVEYAKERIEEGYLDTYTLDALGKEAGFSSRTTFFNSFKKEIGICPSEYWKNYLKEAA